MIFAIFFIVLSLDLIVLPSFLGFYDSSLISLFLISVILYFGINRKTVIFVFLSSLITEFIADYDPGLYVLSFLFCIVILFLISRIFNINPAKNSDTPYNYIWLPFMAVSVNYLLSFIFILISGYIRHSVVFDFRELIDLMTLAHIAESFILLLCLNLIKNIKYH